MPLNGYHIASFTAIPWKPANMKYADPIRTLCQISAMLQIVFTNVKGNCETEDKSNYRIYAYIILVPCIP